MTAHFSLWDSSLGDFQTNPELLSLKNLVTTLNVWLVARSADSSGNACLKSGIPFFFRVEIQSRGS